MRGYDIEEHRHRFALWAASRATARSLAGLGGLTVEEAARLIFGAKLRSDIDAGLPTDRERFDETHRVWRRRILDRWNSAGSEGGRESNSELHGFAAKLIAVYLKVTVICAGRHDDEAARWIHPPVDRLLLEGLIGCIKCGGEPRSDPPRDLPKLRSVLRGGWSRLDSNAYEEVIAILRRISGTEPAWMIEARWNPSLVPTHPRPR